MILNLIECRVASVNIITIIYTYFSNLEVSRGQYHSSILQELLNEEGDQSITIGDSCFILHISGLSELFCKSY